MKDVFKGIYFRVKSNDRLMTEGLNQMTINEFANLCGCNVHTIRHYQEVGILLPHHVDVNSGYRYYDKEQLSEYNTIRRYQSIGFSIKEIKQLLNVETDEVLTALEKRIKEIEEVLNKANQLKKELEDKK